MSDSLRNVSLVCAFLVCILWGLLQGAATLLAEVNHEVHHPIPTGRAGH